MNKGLRRIGVLGLSTIVATTAMTGFAATTHAAAGDYTAASVVEVAQDPAPQAPQNAGSLSLEFANNWNTGATQTFTVASNDCSTAAGISAAVEFAALPTVTVSDPGAANAGGTSPVLSPGVLGSSSAACDTAGITDKVTLNQAAPSTGVVTDTYKVDLTDVKYHVGATAPKGNISVATAGSFKANGSVVNAVIPVASFTNTPLVAALPSAAGVTLGTQSFDETTAGAFFAAGSTTTVSLNLSGTAGFTPGVTPTITVPAGYTKTNPVTVNPALYTFTVTAPATAVAASVTVSGLTASVPAAAQTVTLDATIGTKNVDAVPVINVVKYDARTGGADRYATAVALLKTLPADTDVVLSSGVNFPDALSANYLAGQLDTGTLLTKPDTLPTVVRQAITERGVDTVYITGGTGAVSQAVQDQIEAMHVGNVPAAAFITVVRLGGDNRYETNKLVNESEFVASNTVLLASGANFPDALAFGPIAYGKQFPLILTNGKTLGSSENTQLSDFDPTNVIIAGGTGVVSQAIEDSLKAQGFTVTRLAGADRTKTAAAVATWATGLSTAPFSSSTAYISTGDNFADALAAGPVAGANNKVILLTRSPISLGAGIPSYLGTKTVGTTNATVGTLHALGLTGAVASSLMKAAAATIGN